MNELARPFHFGVNSIMPRGFTHNCIIHEIDFTYDFWAPIWKLKGACVIEVNGGGRQTATFYAQILGRGLDSRWDPYIHFLGTKGIPAEVMTPFEQMLEYCKIFPAAA